MDEMKNRLFLYDQHAGRLYRLALLLLRDKKETEEVIYEMFTALPGRQRRVSPLQWSGVLATECMKVGIARLRARSGGELPLSPLHGGKLSAALDDLPPGARALSVLAHYAHVDIEVAAGWIGIEPADAVSTLYAMEETLGVSPNELSAAWRSQVVLYRPPVWLRERVREFKPVQKKMPVPVWVAGAAAAFLLAFLFINPVISAGYKEPEPTPAPTPVATEAPDEEDADIAQP